MKTVELKGFKREGTGKKVAKVLRNEEKVPCILYGGEKNVNFYVEERDLKSLIYTPATFLLKVDIEGTIYNAIIQDMQYHPVSDRPIHVDFLQISDNKEVKISVPVKLHGFAEGVKQGGKLQLVMRRLKVKALPANLPDQLDINIDDLTLGKTIKIGELDYENLELLDSRNAVVVAVRLTRAARGAMLAAKKEDGNEE